MPTGLPLRAVALKASAAAQDGFPFTLDFIASLGELRFEQPVTFLVGENGTGKSTLLEGLACALGAVAIGSLSLQDDPTLAPARRLGTQLRITRSGRPPRGFFLRAEDAFGFTRRLISSEREMAELEAEFGEELTGYGRQLAMGAVRGQRRAQAERYGEDPNAYSHGESLLSVLQSRVVPEGLYLLDEPETPLSPLRQLALIGLIDEAVDAGAQFVIATHSPILLACPRSTIFELVDHRLEQRAWNELEHVRFTRDFLAAPERFLRHLRHE
ncbi:MAG: AAA family ATPase [Acidobacteriota bacterium]